MDKDDGKSRCKIVKTDFRLFASFYFAITPYIYMGRLVFSYKLWTTLLDTKLFCKPLEGFYKLLS
jgi:hypothetical protein